ncbi:sensor histidine kinase [Streptococcus dentapri]|uniref:histidine kinase n=1 Tax=Streptococcus dentapri TaxID=573564 RepID=A0ABV8CZ88_9STRE
MLFTNNLKQNQRQKKGSSIVKQVTLWYSIFIFLLLLGIFAFAFFVSGSLADSTGKQRLENAALEMSQDIEDYEAFDDGAYYAIYAKDGRLLRGTFPRNFDANLPFSKDKVRTTKAKGDSFYYYDVKIEHSSRWLRAVRARTHISEEYRFFLISLGIIAPLLLVFIVWGGYLILKRAFVPVIHISETAQLITQSQDFSQRISVTNRSDELTQLAVTINKMLETIDTSFEREKQFNHDVSHELRTPLTVILSESEYGQTYASTLADAKESNAIIHRQAQHMKAMVEQILELSRLESHKELSLVSLNLSDLTKQKLQDYQRLLTEKDIQLSSDVDDNLHVLGNELLLSRLLDNIFSNAMKFTKDQIEVRLKAQGRECQLIIADNGLGISKAEKEKIWQKFYQVDAARSKSQQQGVGLGLSLVQEIVRQHHGRIEVVSSENQGAQFIVVLPLKAD